MFFATLPADAPGRTTRNDFVYFEYTFDATQYDVAIESYSGEYLKFAPLSPAVKLPHVHYGVGTFLLVLPKNNPTLPTFVGTLSPQDRGRRYVLNETALTKNGKILMN